MCIRKNTWHFGKKRGGGAAHHLSFIFLILTCCCGSNQVRGGDTCPLNWRCLICTWHLPIKAHILTHPPTPHSTLMLVFQGISLTYSNRSLTKEQTFSLGLFNQWRAGDKAGSPSCACNRGREGAGQGMRKSILRASPNCRLWNAAGYTTYYPCKARTRASVKCCVNMSLNNHLLSFADPVQIKRLSVINYRSSFGVSLSVVQNSVQTGSFCRSVFPSAISLHLVAPCAVQTQWRISRGLSSGVMGEAHALSTLQWAEPLRPPPLPPPLPQAIPCAETAISFIYCFDLFLLVGFLKVFLKNAL